MILGSDETSFRTYPVSYTHLDVYKRQYLHFLSLVRIQRGKGIVVGQYVIFRNIQHLYLLMRIDVYKRQELADVERNLEFLEQSTMRYRSGKMQEGLEKDVYKRQMLPMPISLKALVLMYSEVYSSQEPITKWNNMTQTKYDKACLLYTSKDDVRHGELLLSLLWIAAGSVPLR